MTQFRKYQVMMAWLHADALKRSFSPSTPKHERMAAIRTTGYLLGTTGFMGGAVGLPAANLALTAFQMAFGDEDEPEPKDLERMIRDHYADSPEVATLLSRGVPAFLGLDMSTKMSLNDLFQPWDTRFVSPEASRDGMINFAGQLLLGPTASPIGRAGTAAQYFQEGDIYRGVESLAPKGTRTGMEAFRFGTEGYEVASSILADPRDFNMFDLMTNAMGLPSEKINTMKWRSSQQWELETFFRDESTRLRQAYVDAYRAKDTTRMSELRKEFRELQRAKDRVRPFFNNAPTALRKQPISSMTSAPRDYRRRERDRRREFGSIN